MAVWDPNEEDAPEGNPIHAAVALIIAVLIVLAVAYLR